MRFSSKLASTGKFSDGTLIYECYRATSLLEMQNLIKFMLDTHIVYPNTYSQLDLLCDYADYADYFKKANQKFFKGILSEEINRPPPATSENPPQTVTQQQKSTIASPPPRSVNLDNFDLEDLKPSTPPYNLRSSNRRTPFQSYIDK